jgi:uncharacterized protein involved in exopolysaccharide biosynthesis
LVPEQRRLTSGEDDDIPFEHATAPTQTEWASFALGGLRRRKLVAALVFAAIMAATVVYYARKEPVYRAEAKVLAQRSQGLPTAVRSTFDELPTRTAWEVVHQRENLTAIIRQTNLLDDQPKAPPQPAWKRWGSLGAFEGKSSQSNKGQEPSRPAPGDTPTGVHAGSATRDDALEELVTTLDKELRVRAGDDGTITLQLDWADPDQAHAIIQAALQNFLEARHVQEVTAIDAVISVLQGRTAIMRDNLDKVMDQARRRASQPVVAPVPRVRQPSEELVRLQVSLEGKQRALQDVEDFRRRRLSELQAQLDQARTMLSDAHPTVIGLRRDIEAFGRESPQVQALRDEERQLRKLVSDRLAREDFPSGARVMTAAPIVSVPASPNEDPAVRDARVQYEQMAARTTAAQVDLDAARAAFKYRYNVVWPPQVSKEPVAPKPAKTFALGTFAAMFLALLAAIGPDLLSGRIFERWQVERKLGLPVLGDVRKDL